MVLLDFLGSVAMGSARVCSNFDYENLIQNIVMHDNDRRHGAFASDVCNRIRLDAPPVEVNHQRWRAGLSGVSLFCNRPYLEA